VKIDRVRELGAPVPRLKRRGAELPNTQAQRAAPSGPRPRYFFFIFCCFFFSISILLQNLNKIFKFEQNLKFGQNFEEICNSISFRFEQKFEI
jgi:hypothetical protein